MEYLEEAIVSSEKIVVHDCDDRANLVYLGRLLSGGDLIINRIAAEATVKEGGVIIMLSKSNDGHGGNVFYETFRGEKNLKKMMEQFENTPPDKTIVDQWQSQIFARVLMRAQVIFVSDAPDEIVSDLHMIPAHSLDEALQKADALLAKRGITDGSILAIPDGVSVMVIS